MITVLRRLRPIPALLLGVLALNGCPVNPATGERQLILISESQEIAMGLEVSQQVEATMGLYDDPELQRYVSGIGETLAAQSEKPNLPWSFKVVDDDLVNAFALPGGYIFVTRGILAYFNSEAELAGVLGHEIGHVTARHSAEQLSRAQVAQIGLVAGSVFVPEFSPYADLAGTGLGLLFLKFGRDDERQSDDLGFRYMTRAGYDPTEMVEVFDMLGRVSEASGGNGIPSWLSTHPDPGERRERMERALAEAGAAGVGRVARDDYMRRIDGLVFGENPRKGFFRGQDFLHPDLQFQLRFPPDWPTQNTAQAVVGVSPGKDAIIQLSIGQGATSDEAANHFLSQSGINVGERRREPVNGLPATWATFGARTSDGTDLRGVVVFIDYNNLTYQILGYTVANKMNTYTTTFRASLGSFNRLTDKAALGVQPKRLDLVTIDRSMTLEEFARVHPSTVPLATLELINGVQQGASIPRGTLVKRVVGEDPPK
ncbi:MAG: M48 family metalloprotease [Gemmatimonadota bacterium]|nr:MAG: M48 family metalloprotease [Gemmatimonadota bacterium]